MHSYEFEIKKNDVLNEYGLILTHQYDLKLKDTQMIYVPAVLSKDNAQKITEEIYSFEKRELLQNLDKLTLDFLKSSTTFMDA